ncbi:dienelactone hydrolase family protein [Actinoallomurus bryophytorum]|uniref:Dienelactone hydrolase n=1 Tax=Actinoallomurus bryophytorum TaxID=1490222 RepID=A0A543BSY1_9ACTN|nr:alpha/beta family hydrolase [Actinoallomurus bryophytorum]TQL87920.1 dienelactone hydrolase [Actinoallomurus bryophytorum]
MNVVEKSLHIPVAGVVLEADVVVPDQARGVVLFAHGSGSGRHSPRNRRVASELRVAGLATVLTDLLTPAEEQRDAWTAELRFSIGLLAARVAALTDWVRMYSHTEGLGVGVFGASTGAAAALVAAAERPGTVQAVVSRGGRPDLAGEHLSDVFQPTLLLVGGDDPVVIDLNREALTRLPGEARLEIVPGASHLFEEPGTLEQAARLARDWFLLHLRPVAHHADLGH